MILNYRPEGMLMWDAWYHNTGSEVHAFHLQRLAPGSQKTVYQEHAVGHAVSEDMIHWKELPPAVYPGEPGSLDDREIFTGCTCEKDGIYYLFYTMKSSRENGNVQRIGLATSRDLLNWEKHPNNPVLTPDSRWYHTEEDPALYGLADCRDICIVKAPDQSGYYAFFVARVRTEEMAQGSVVALAYSEDLIHWEQYPPVFSSCGRYTIAEVPVVFPMDGKWYMLLLCNNEYGNRDLFASQPQYTMGTIYAVADSIEGPYIEPENNVLLGSQGFNALSCQTVEFKGKRLLMYTQASRTNCCDAGDPMMGVLTTPKELAVRDGRLCALYSPLLEAARREALITPQMLQNPVECRLMYQTPGVWQAEGECVTGSVKTAWARYTLPVKARSFILETNLTISNGVGAGVAIKQAEHGYGGLICMLDVQKQEVQLLRIPNLAVVDSRKIKLTHGKDYHLRVVSKDKYLEVFLDDELVLQCVCYSAREGYMGFAVDRAEAVFTGLRAWELECPLDEI